ncbi:hypothetical protein [Candidatus Nitrospira bockiana]
MINGHEQGVTDYGVAGETVRRPPAGKGADREPVRKFEERVKRIVTMAVLGPALGGMTIWMAQDLLASWAEIGLVVCAGAVLSLYIRREIRGVSQEYNRALGRAETASG